MRELAAATVTSTEEYMAVLGQLRSGDPAAFAAARQKAYSMTLVLGQFSCSLLELSPQIATLPAELRPPASVVLAVGAISGACALIAAAETQAKLDNVALPSAQRLEALLGSEQAQAWLRHCLAQQPAVAG